MARVTRPGGVIAASVWDFGAGRGPVSLFWRAVLELDPATDESDLPALAAGIFPPCLRQPARRTSQRRR